MHTAVRKHKIDEDQDIIDMKDANTQAEKERFEKVAKENEISTENIAKINADIQGLPECPEMGRPQVLNFDYWLALFKILNFHVNRESHELRAKQAPIRRNCLTDKNMQNYQKVITGH